MGAELDSTQRSFPPYAELTQTQAWGAKAVPVHADAGPSVELSHGSRYTEGAELGRGGMGKVVLARDARVGRDVAVKVLHPDRELEPDERARFLREAMVQGQLEHPSIVPVYDIDRRADGTTFFTMRRVLGRTLSAILDDLRTGVPAAKARYTQRELLTAFSTVCLTIDYAHSRGVVHRDLKPANIMLGDFGEVYVLDWGLARLVDEAGESTDGPAQRLSMPGELMGTPMYMAPEQMAAPDVGPAADVYSLGLILFELLTLERCRDPNALFAPVDARPSVRTPTRAVPPELESICVRATEIEPKDRFASPRALQEAINRYLEGDRELEQRRKLAGGHLDAARSALARAGGPNANYEQERGTAVREVGRAIALDPHNAESVAMLGQLVSATTDQVPAEVRAELDVADQAVIRFGAKHAMTGILSWWLFVPFVLWCGLRATGPALVIGALMVLVVVINIVMTRQRRVAIAIQVASMVTTFAAAAAISRLFGPYVLVPALITTFAVVLQAHPIRQLRVVGAVAAGFAIVIPPLLEWLGVTSPSYLFTHGTWTIVPHMIELPQVATNAFLTLAHVAILIIPCMFIYRLRGDLERAQERLAVQAWHYKQLGAQLIGQPDAP